MEDFPSHRESLGAWKGVYCVSLATVCLFNASAKQLTNFLQSMILNSTKIIRVRKASEGHTIAGHTVSNTCKTIAEQAAKSRNQ